MEISNTCTLYNIKESFLSYLPSALYLGKVANPESREENQGECWLDGERDGLSGILFDGFQNLGKSIQDWENSMSRATGLMHYHPKKRKKSSYHQRVPRQENVREELAKFLEIESDHRMSVDNIVSKIKKYVEEKKIWRSFKDPNSSYTEILCDEALKQLFKVKGIIRFCIN